MSAKGFTLLEIMMVVAIIGILVAVAVPTYKDYTAKAIVASALQEIMAGKSSYEYEVNHSSTVLSKAEDINLPSDTEYCEIEVYNPNSAGNADPAIECAIKNANIVGSGAKIAITRNSDGFYGCKTTNIKEKHRPMNCD